MRLKAERDRKYKNTYDETDEEFMDYQREMFEQHRCLSNCLQSATL